TPVRFVFPWFGSGFALTTLWMVLPNVFVPVAFATLAILFVEIGLACDTPDLVWHGRVLSLAATSSLLVSNTVNARIGNAAATSLARWTMWYRTRRQTAAAAHGWIAAIVVAMIPWHWPHYVLGWWSLYGLSLAAAGRSLRISQLRWQSVVLGA